MANNQGDILPINGPDDYRKFFHTDPMSGYIWLDGHGKPILKDYPLTKQIVDSISPTDLWNSRQCRYQLHTEPGNIINTNAAHGTLLNPTGGYTVISKQPTTPKLHSLNFDDISPVIANNTKAQRQENESYSNLHDSQNSTQAILDDIIFTVKALSDKVTSNPNSSPALFSKVKNFLDRSLEGVNEALINGYKIS